MRLNKIIKISTILLLPIFSMGCLLTYVLKQGYYQAKLICGAEAIKEVLKDANLSAYQKTQLKKILEIREFGQKELGLIPGANYTTVNLSWNQYIYNVSASEVLAFRPFTWWFPIVGTVPYKGYFVENDAQKEYEHLKSKGYDVIKRKVGGYSTLGYFTDPVWPQMLDRLELSLADLIIHETAHTTIYFSSETDFNENFANFVGKQGALEYLAKKYGPNSLQVKSANNYYHDSDLYMQFMWGLYNKLDEVYKSNKSNQAKLTQKMAILNNLANDYKKVKFLSAGYTNHPPKNLNNALLMSFKRYNSDQSIFAEVFKKLGGSWPKFIEEMGMLKKAKNPLIALKELAGKL